MTAAPLLAVVLPGSDSLAASEMYDDPPELAPLPEEEPLIAKSVAKRRNEFITVRYCARQALGELGVPPAPILKGDKGEPCWPDGVVGSLTGTATGVTGGLTGAVGGAAGSLTLVPVTTTVPLVNPVVDTTSTVTNDLLSGLKKPPKPPKLPKY